MKAQVIGIGTRNRGAASKSTGKPYDGQTIYVTTKAHDVVGQKAEEVYFNYLSNLAYPEVSVGDLLDLGYNSKGFLVEVEVVKKAEKK